MEKEFNDITKDIDKTNKLHLPDYRFPFILRTDASGTGLGAILMQ